MALARVGLAKWNGRFHSVDFTGWDHEVLLCIDIKFFICHSAAAAHFLETDNISPVFRHIIEKWPFWIHIMWSYGYFLLPKWPDISWLDQIFPEEKCQRIWGKFSFVSQAFTLTNAQKWTLFQVPGFPSTKYTHQKLVARETGTKPPMQHCQATAAASHELKRTVCCSSARRKISEMSSNTRQDSQRADSSTCQGQYTEAKVARQVGA